MNRPDITSPTSDTPDILSAGTLPSCRPFWQIAAVIALVISALAVTLTYVWNFDIHWHLASGQWMLQHHRPLGHDPFSYDPPPQWLNGHWFFQVVTAALFSLGGWAALSIEKAFCAALAMFIFAMSLRKRISPAWLIVCGLAMIEIMQQRIRVRPESFSMLFLTATLVLVDGVRMGNRTRRLWWMAPIMLLWANSQGLFMLGVGVIVSSLVGAVADRTLRKQVPLGNLLTQDAVIPLLAAMAMCAVTPWPLEMLTNPFVLARRISGKEFYYTYGVSELQPTYEVLSYHSDAILLVCVTALAMILNFRRVPLAHMAWFGVFAFLSLLARRNAALLGPVCGYLLAVHGQDIIARVVQRKRRLSSIGPVAAVVAITLAGAVSYGYATERVFRHRGIFNRFGAGLQTDNYPTDIAKWLGNLKADGDIMCDGFGDAGVFIYYNSTPDTRETPVRKVYLDGRNEFHTLQRFIEVHRIRRELGSTSGAASVALPSDVRFIFVRYDNTGALSSMMQNPQRFRLVRLDDMGACFARLDWTGTVRERPTSNLPDRPNIDDYERALDANGLLAGWNYEKPAWYRQNPPATTYRLGTMFLALGRCDWDARVSAPSRLQKQCLLLSLRYLNSAVRENLAPAAVTVGGLAMACQQRSFQSPELPEDAPLDVNSARALYLFDRLNLSRIDEQNAQQLAMERVRAFLQARQIDAADAAMRDLMENILPPRLRVNPPEQDTNLRRAIDETLTKSKVLKAQRKISQMPLLAQARALTAPDVGLIEPAIETLKTAAITDRETQLFRADLLLKRGQPEQAREILNKLPPGDKDDNRIVSLRLALCDWVEGKLFEARDSLGKLGSKNPVVKYYLDELNMQIGDKKAPGGI